MGKCSFPDGIIIKPDGENELDPCFYQLVEKWENVTIEISRCKNCGHYEISWYKQDNSKRLDDEVIEETIDDDL